MSVRRLSTSSALNGFPKSPNAWDQTTNAATFDCLGVIEVGSTANTSIVFTGIPQTYQHLQIRSTARTNRSAGGDDVYIRFNNDTNANYYWHQNYIGLSSATPGTATIGYSNSLGTSAGILTPPVTATNATANLFGASIIDILDYTNINKATTVRSYGGIHYAGTDTSYIGFYSGYWDDTSNITNITLSANGSFVQYSSIALYGVK